MYKKNTLYERNIDPTEHDYLFFTFIRLLIEKNYNCCVQFPIKRVNKWSDSDSIE